MTKNQLIESLAKKAGIKKIKSEIIVNILFDTIAQALIENKRVEVRGFGSFVNRDYGSYIGRDPRNGSRIRVLSKRVPFFKIGKDFKKRLNS